jgi:hypothetical protein
VEAARLRRTLVKLYRLIAPTLQLFNECPVLKLVLFLVLMLVLRLVLVMA